MNPLCGNKLRILPVDMGRDAAFECLLILQLELYSRKLVRAHCKNLAQKRTHSDYIVSRCAFPDHRFTWYIKWHVVFQYSLVLIASCIFQSKWILCAWTMLYVKNHIQVHQLLKFLFTTIFRWIFKHYYEYWYRFFFLLFTLDLFACCVFVPSVDFASLFIDSDEMFCFMTH